MDQEFTSDKCQSSKYHWYVVIVLRTLIAVVVESHVVLRIKPPTPIRQNQQLISISSRYPQPLRSSPQFRRSSIRFCQAVPSRKCRMVCEVDVRSRCGGWAARGIYFPHEAQEQLLPQLPVVVC